jgi:hypothetical protein
MKISIIILSFTFLFTIINSCQQKIPPDNKQEAIDSLKTIINQLKPGLGEFMMQFEYHHDRLAKSIREKNFERAAYETDELKETAEKLIQLHVMNDKLQQPFIFFYDKYLKSVLEILSNAAAKKDEAALNSNVVALTNNCNSCHHENNMGFMKIEP